MAVYRSPQDGPRQAREDRPNPRWPQEEKIEAWVARVRAIIAGNPAALCETRSPVAEIVSGIVEDDWAASRVVEGVLADSACRFMLTGVGLHGGGAPRKRGAKK